MKPRRASFARDVGSGRAFSAFATPAGTRASGTAAVLAQKSYATWRAGNNNLSVSTHTSGSIERRASHAIRPRPALRVAVRVYGARFLPSSASQRHPLAAQLSASLPRCPPRAVDALLQSAAMGLAASLPEESAYAPFQALGLGYTEELVRSYKERDLDFGIDLPTIEGLTGLDRDQCIQLVESLAKNDPRERKLVNALLLSGACIAGEADGISAASRIFDIFDFDARGQISRDELTILLLCSLRAANAIQGLQDEPDDDATEIISDAAFDQAIPPQGNPDVITKKEFELGVACAGQGLEVSGSSSSRPSCGITPGIDNEETDLAAAKLQARIRGRNERLNPTAPPAKTVDEPASEETAPEEPSSPEEPSPAPEEPSSPQRGGAAGA